MIFAQMDGLGIGLAIRFLLPISFIVSVSIAPLLRCTTVSRQLDFVVVLLLPVGCISAGTLLLTSSWALAFAVPGGANNDYFWILYLIVIAVLALLHYAAYQLCKFLYRCMLAFCQFVFGNRRPPGDA